MGAPNHVAIIMDGNGRWAKKKGFPRAKGHLEGVSRVEEILRASIDQGIKVLTVYAFSTENWNRPDAEVNMLMKTFETVLGNKTSELDRNGICIRFLGKRDNIPNEVLKAIEKAEKITRDNTKMTFNVAFNYGSRIEILDATRAIVKSVQDKKLNIEDLDEKVFSEFLYTKGLPDPDLVIRTSGEMRISNFLLWQSSYAEYYFTDKYWPEFTKEELCHALEDYANRERRYGNVE